MSDLVINLKGRFTHDKAIFVLEAIKLLGS